MSQQTKPIRWTIRLAVREFRISRATLSRRLAKQRAGKDGCYSTRQILDALGFKVASVKRKSGRPKKQPAADTLPAPAADTLAGFAGMDLLGDLDKLEARLRT